MSVKRLRINPMAQCVCSTCCQETLSIPETKHRKCVPPNVDGMDLAKGTWIKK